MPMSFDPRRWDWVVVLCWLFAVASGICLVVALQGPFAVLTRHLYGGTLEKVAKAMSPEDFKEYSYTLFQSITELLHQPDWWVAIVIIIFSVCFPIAKLALLVWIISCKACDERVYMTLVKHLGWLGKWSMLDVFVLAMLVVTVRKLPGGSHLELQYGAYAFGISVLLAGVCSQLLQWDIRRTGDNADTGAAPRCPLPLAQ